MSLDRRHRPFQLLAAATVVVGLLPIAFAASLADPVALAGAYFAWTLAAYLWAAGGTLVAATTFAPGEPQRPGWLLLSASYAVLLPGRLLAGPSPGGLSEGSIRLPTVVSAFSITSAALGVVGFLVLARAWRASGLDLSTRPTRLAMRLGALLVAMAAAGPDLVARFPAATQGDPIAMVDVVTDLLDGALFVVAVPVLSAALALGGGLVVWPWTMLTLSLLAWLGFDAAVVSGQALGLSPRDARVVEEVMRALGASGAFAAGVAQRWVMQPPPGSAAEQEPPAP